jgi:hypothetical protein
MLVSALHLHQHCYIAVAVRRSTTDCDENDNVISRAVASKHTVLDAACVNAKFVMA